MRVCACVCICRNAHCTHTKSQLNNVGDFPIKSIINADVGKNRCAWESNSQFFQGHRGVNENQSFFQGGCVAFEVNMGVTAPKYYLCSSSISSFRK